MKSLPGHAGPALILAALMFAAPSAAQKRRAAPAQRGEETERPVEASVSADSYAVFAEVRRPGQLARTNEVKTVVDALRLFGGAPREIMDAADFLTANEEALAEARVVVCTLAARPDVPQFLLALQFPTPEAARGFESKLRVFFSNQSYAETGAAEKGRGVRRASPKRTAATALVVRRAGSWLYAADQPFTFRSLRGDGAYLVANNARLQSFRNRLANEYIFVYFDTALSRRGWQLQIEKAESASAEAAATTHTIQSDPGLTPPDERPIPFGDPDSRQTPPVVPEVAEAPPEQTPTIISEEAPTPEAEPKVEAETETPVVVVESEQKNSASARDATAEERAAKALVSGLLSGLFEGGLREPDTVGVGIGLEGDHLVARVLVAKDAGKPTVVIPFLPNVVSGPAIIPDSLSVAPADSEVFITASLDWSRIYDVLVAGAEERLRHAAWVDDEGRPHAGPEEVADQPAGAGKMVESLDKLFGFRLREELLPALGNEVAVSLPLDWFEGGGRRIKEERRVEEETGGKRAEAGPVVIISLNNPDAARRIMPLLLAALGQRGPGLAERRNGFEIQDHGQFAYVFINNYLVAGEGAPAVRHVVDAYSSNRTLAVGNKFRDAVAWQENQRLALAYVSDRLMKRWSEGTKKMAAGSADPIVLAALAQLDVTPAPVSYAVTDDTDALRHELRLPTGLVKIYAASTLIGIKEAPVYGNESGARYALERLWTAEEQFKNAEGKGRYGSLEELQAMKLVDKEYGMTEEYAFELRATGDRFTATATPKNYGKTARRSFYVDETGVLRAADHKGEPATAADPPVDQ